MSILIVKAVVSVLNQQNTPFEDDIAPSFRNLVRFTFRTWHNNKKYSDTKLRPRSLAVVRFAIVDERMNMDGKETR